MHRLHMQKCQKTALGLHIHEVDKENLEINWRLHKCVLE